MALGLDHWPQEWAADPKGKARCECTGQSCKRLSTWLVVAPSMPPEESSRESAVQCRGPALCRLRARWRSELARRVAGLGGVLRSGRSASHGLTAAQASAVQLPAEESPVNATPARHAPLPDEKQPRVLRLKRAQAAKLVCCMSSESDPSTRAHSYRTEGLVQSCKASALHQERQHFEAMGRTAGHRRSPSS